MTEEEAHERAKAILGELRAHPEVAKALSALSHVPAQAPRPHPQEPPRRAVSDVAAAIAEALRSGANIRALRASRETATITRLRTLEERMSLGDFRLEERAMAAVRDANLPRSVAMDLAARALVWWRGGVRRGCVLVLSGPRGVGKTVAAVRCVLEGCERPHFVTAADVAATPNNAWPENRERWARWRGADGLVLDELGLEAEEGDARHVTGLMFARYQSGLLTLCTTNLDAAEVRARYLTGEAGESLLHRLTFAQGDVLTEGDRPRVGPDGMGWYRPVEGPNLRDRAVRASFAEAPVFKRVSGK